MNHPQQPPDWELVEAARMGKREAFDSLIERHFAMVFAIAYAGMANPETAEDLAQEVFLRAYLHLDKLSDTARFAAWMSRIARNLTHDWQRRGQRASRLVSMLSLEELPVEIDDRKAKGARETMVAEEESGLLRDAIFKLPQVQREIVLLHFMENMGRTEIAEKLDVHPSTVARQLHQALATLKRSLEPMLQQSVGLLRPQRSAALRTTAIIAAASALTASSKASLAASAESLVLTSSVPSSAASALHGFPALLSTLKSAPALIMAGGKIMGIGKVATATVVIIAASIGGVYLTQANEPKSAPATSIQQTAKTEKPVGKLTEADYRSAKDECFTGEICKMILKIAADEKNKLNPTGSMPENLQIAAIDSQRRPWRATIIHVDNKWGTTVSGEQQFGTLQSDLEIAIFNDQNQILKHRFGTENIPNNQKSLHVTLDRPWPAGEARTFIILGASDKPFDPSAPEMKLPIANTFYSGGLQQFALVALPGQQVTNQSNAAIITASIKEPEANFKIYFWQ